MSAATAVFVWYLTPLMLTAAGSGPAEVARVVMFAPEIPKLFMVVADPVGAGLARSLDKPGRGDLTRTFNRVPEQVNIETLRSYRPGFRRLGRSS